jgi:hypothetical protein
VWAGVFLETGWPLLGGWIEQRSGPEDHVDVVVLGETPKWGELLTIGKCSCGRRKWSGGENKNANRGGAANVPTECRHESV